MKVVIAGGRDFEDSSLLFSRMDEFHEEFQVSEVVSGGTTGADRLGERWAASKNIPVKKFPALWHIHGRAAGPIRNKQMAQYADAVIVFWDRKSPGTKNMIGNGHKQDKLVYINYYEKK